MSRIPTDEELTAGVARAFTRAFARELGFRPDLERSHEPRWSSLKHIEFMIAMEAEFGIRFDGADATDMTSIAAVLDLLRARLG